MGSLTRGLEGHYPGHGHTRRPEPLTDMVDMRAALYSGPRYHDPPPPVRPSGRRMDHHPTPAPYEYGDGRISAAQPAAMRSRARGSRAASAADHFSQVEDLMLGHGPQETASRRTKRLGAAQHRMAGYDVEYGMMDGPNIRRGAPRPQTLVGDPSNRKAWIGPSSRQQQHGDPPSAYLQASASGSHRRHARRLSSAGPGDLGYGDHASLMQSQQYAAALAQQQQQQQADALDLAQARAAYARHDDRQPAPRGDHRQHAYEDRQHEGDPRSQREDQQLSWRPTSVYDAPLDLRSLAAGNFGDPALREGAMREAMREETPPGGDFRLGGGGGVRGDGTDRRAVSAGCDEAAAHKRGRVKTKASAKPVTVVSARRSGGGGDPYTAPAKSEAGSSEMGTSGSTGLAPPKVKARISQARSTSSGSMEHRETARSVQAPLARPSSLELHSARTTQSAQDGAPGAYDRAGAAPRGRTRPTHTYRSFSHDGAPPLAGRLPLQPDHAHFGAPAFSQLSQRGSPQDAPPYADVYAPHGGPHPLRDAGAHLEGSGGGGGDAGQHDAVYAHRPHAREGCPPLRVSAHAEHCEASPSPGASAHHALALQAIGADMSASEAARGEDSSPRERRETPSELDAHFAGLESDRLQRLAAESLQSLCGLNNLQNCIVDNCVDDERLVALLERASATQQDSAALKPASDGYNRAAPGSWSPFPDTGYPTDYNRSSPSAPHAMVPPSGTQPISSRDYNKLYAPLGLSSGPSTGYCAGQLYPPSLASLGVTSHGPASGSHDPQSTTYAPPGHPAAFNYGLHSGSQYGPGSGSHVPASSHHGGPYSGSHGPNSAVPAALAYGLHNNAGSANGSGVRLGSGSLDAGGGVASLPLSRSHSSGRDSRDSHHPGSPQRPGTLPYGDAHDSLHPAGSGSGAYSVSLKPDVFVKQETWSQRKVSSGAAARAADSGGTAKAPVSGKPPVQKKRPGPVSCRDKIWALFSKKDQEMLLNNVMNAATATKKLLEQRAAFLNLSDLTQLPEDDDWGCGYKLTEAKATANPLDKPKSCSICQRQDMVFHRHSYYCRRCAQLYRAIHRKKNSDSALQRESPDGVPSEDDEATQTRSTMFTKTSARVAARACA